MTVIRSLVFACATLLVANAVPAKTVSSETRPMARDAGVVVEDMMRRPLARPGTPQTDAQATAKIAVMRPLMRPYERPDLEIGASTSPLRRAEENMFAFSPYAPRQSLRPAVRPAAITQRAVERKVARVRGQICGDPAIQGEKIGNVPGPGKCGVTNGVKVRSVAGVTLKPAATIDCKTASALKAWVAQAVKPIVGTTGGGVSSLRIIGSYSCRKRNGAATGRISEHAFGHAVDIAGIGLKNGRELTVLTDWRRAGSGDMLKRAWKSACGPFGTVLGPNANAAHRDHFHFDTARYRSGSYCR